MAGPEHGFLMGYGAIYRSLSRIFRQEYVTA
jgi:hypothetical protein